MAEQKDDVKPSFRITYYPVHGRGAPLRAAASIGGISYENKLITPDEQKKLKTEGEMRWSGVPQLTIIGEGDKDLITVAQSNSCLRYIGLLYFLFIFIYIKSNQ